MNLSESLNPVQAMMRNGSEKHSEKKPKKLLENKEVDVIVGFGEGTLPLRATADLYPES